MSIKLQNLLPPQIVEAIRRSLKPSIVGALTRDERVVLMRPLDRSLRKPAKDFPLDRITSDEADTILDGNHYLHGTHIKGKFCLATPERDAVAVFGPCRAASFNVQFHEPLELMRLWRRGGAPVRTDQFLHRACLRVAELAPDCDVIITYADTGQGHEGKVYKGAGFTRIGETKSHKTNSYDTPEGRITDAVAYRRLGTKSRKEILAARPDWKFIEGTTKILYVFPLAAKPSEVIETLSSGIPEARRHLFSKSHSGFRQSVYAEKFPSKNCARCNKLFLSKRADALTCSTRCRVALSRKRKRKAKA